MRYIYLGIISCAVVTAACKDGSVDDFNPDGPDKECQTDYTTYTSPATGILTLQGQFYANETVIIEKHDVNGPATVVAQGTPASDRTSFTLTGLPSGQHDYYFIISCDNGRDQENETFTVK